MSEEHDARIYDRCIVRVGQLEAENAELRELVRDIYASAEFWIDHFGEGQKLRNRMRELGVEV